MNEINQIAKKRELKLRIHQLQSLVAQQRKGLKHRIQHLILQIKQLLVDLWHVVHKYELKRIVGAAAIYLGLSFASSASAQSFASPKINPFGIAASTYFAIPTQVDLDGDGDYDVILADYYGIHYYKNNGTAKNPSFSKTGKFPFGLSDTIDFPIPEFVDIDGDGDLDAFLGDGYGDMYYQQNTGTKTSPAFAAPIKNPFGLTDFEDEVYLAFVDLDGDGDFDLLVGTLEEPLQYFQNTGTKTAPAFAAVVTNPFGLKEGKYISIPDFADLDKDGDMDLLVGQEGGSMLYFKNTGTKASPAFAAPVTNPFGLKSVSYYASPSFADLDGDGDIDLMVGDYYYGRLYYFENVGSSGINEISTYEQVNIYPNPASNVLHINSIEPIIKLEITDLSGRVLEVYDNPATEIAIDQLKSGSYILKTWDTNENYSAQPLIKQ